jgi:phosphopantetheinyl transferase
MIAANAGARTAATARLVVALADMPVVPARTVSRRLQSRIGRVLAREAAARLSGCPPGEFQVAGGGDARPYLTVCPRAAGDLLIALSHSGAWVGAAAGCGLTALGIDVQEIKPRRVDRLAGLMNWTQRLRSPAGGELTDPDRFTHLWTLWEAAVKCDGAALLAKTTPAFQRLSRQCVPGREGSWSAEGYWALSRRVAPGYWLTVVAHCGDATIPSLETLRVAVSPALSQQA